MAMHNAPWPSIDWHIHTTLSDGLAPPETVLAKAAALGLTQIAVTDHDCIDAHRDGRLAGQGVAGAPEVIPGVEIDCCLGEGLSEAEILGYAFDPRDDALGARLARVQVQRRRRFQFYCDGLVGMGEPVDPARVLPPGTVVPIKVHLYRALAAAGRTFPGGYLEFRQHLDSLGPAPPLEHPPVEEAVALIHAAGGFALLAHPLYYLARNPAAALLARARAVGCCGAELSYPYDFGARGLAVAEVRTQLGVLLDHLAEVFPGGACVTRGSDVHDLTEWEERLATLVRWDAELAPRLGALRPLPGNLPPAQPPSARPT